MPAATCLIIGYAQYKSNSQIYIQAHTARSKYSKAIIAIHSKIQLTMIYMPVCSGVTATVSLLCLSSYISLPFARISPVVPGNATLAECLVLRLANCTFICLCVCAWLCLYVPGLDQFVCLTIPRCALP